jgi:ornithine cyclodeaminase/alanine dehydrogenase-like protein (mu-crystallin family)
MSKSETLPYLSRSELESLSISTDEVVSTIEGLIRGTVESQAWNAPKMVITPPDGRYMMATLSASDDPPFLAVKSLVLNPKNREKGLSEINSLVTLLHSGTGLPLAVIDGNWVTAVRTAGLSAVAAKRLARPESSVIAFVGCGVQANSHLQAFADLFPIGEVRAFNRGRENREALCRTAEAMGFAAHSCEQIEETIRGADLIVTSISWSQNIEAFVDAAWVKPGGFASVVDLGIPWIDESMAAFDRIIIDDLAQESQMDSPIVDLSLVDGDLTGLLTNGVDGRLASDEKTAFVFRGFALGDLALATLAYEAFRVQSPK